MREYQKHGFFHLETFPKIILAIVLLWDIVMFLPPIYKLTCADGTAVQCWLIGIELILAPGLAFIYGLCSKSDASSEDDSCD